VEGSTEARLRRDAIDDPVAELADHRLVRTRQAWTGVQRDPVPLDVRHADHPLGTVLTLDGELDLATAPLLQKPVDRAIRGKGAVVIDLSRLRFIDSSGLNVLVMAERQLRASGRLLVLVYGSRSVRRVFELTSLDRYFASCDSPGAALRTARERRIGSRRIPKSATNRQIAGELDDELPGAMSP
jgi:anti-anti-sigma factor